MTHNENILLDSLYNCTVDCSTAKINYGRGVLVGVVSGVMHGLGIPFEDAVKYVCDLMKRGWETWPCTHRLHHESVPQVWMKEFTKHYEVSGPGD